MSIFIIMTWPVYTIHPSIFRELNISIKMTCLKSQSPVAMMKRPVVEYAMWLAVLESPTMGGESGSEGVQIDFFFFAAKSPL